MTPIGMTRADWKALLGEGEALLWQGRPGTGISFYGRDVLTLGMGLLFIIIPLGMLSVILTTPERGFFHFMPVIHLLLGLCMFLNPLLWRPYVRRKTHYALSDRNALILSDLPWRRRLETYPLRRMEQLSLDMGRRKSVWFDKRSSFASNMPRIPVGFELIPDAPKVYAMMVNAKEAA